MWWTHPSKKWLLRLVCVTVRQIKTLKNYAHVYSTVQRWKVASSSLPCQKQYVARWEWSSTNVDGASDSKEPRVSGGNKDVISHLLSSIQTVQILPLCLRMADFEVWFINITISYSFILIFYQPFCIYWLSVVQLCLLSVFQIIWSAWLVSEKEKRSQLSYHHHDGLESCSCSFKKS